jgi:predicted transcriptional regulator YdeE
MPLVSTEPTRLELPDLKLVGTCAFADFFSNNQHTLFGETWERFLKHVGEVQNQAGTTRFFGMELYPQEFPADRRWYYLACVEVSDLAVPYPPNMVGRFIPAAEYLRFTIDGPVTEIGPAMRFICDQWLPKSNVKRNHSYDLEMYDERFKDPCDERSQMDILIPLG